MNDNQRGIASIIIALAAGALVVWAMITGITEPVAPDPTIPPAVYHFEEPAR